MTSRPIKLALFLIPFIAAPQTSFSSATVRAEPAVGGCRIPAESPLQFEIEEVGSLWTDGKGAYRHGLDCMWAGVFWHGGAQLVSLRHGASQLPWDSACKGSDRTVFVNLNRPVAGSGAKPQGVMRATLTKFKLFYRFEGNNKIYSLFEMPVGASAKSPWTQISIDNTNLKLDSAKVGFI